MAAQATGSQIVAYAAMIKSTEAANAELKAFLEQLGKSGGAFELASRSATLDQAIETARTENKKFLDGFSDTQKSGLKEITKRLTKGRMRPGATDQGAGPGGPRRKSSRPTGRGLGTESGTRAYEFPEPADCSGRRNEHRGRQEQPRLRF